jgi:hypothetical protein
MYKTIFISFLFFTVIPSQVQLCDSLYNEGEYDSALSCFDNLASEKRGQVPILKKLGILNHIMNRREQGDSFFDSLLQQDPAHELDPLYVSPEIIESFNRIKRKYSNGSVKADTIVQIQVVDKKTRFIRPMHLLPYGAGHILDKRTKKGLFFLGLGAAALTANILAYNTRSGLRTDNNGYYYDPDRAFSLYKTQIMSFYGIFVPIGVFSIVDCIVFRKER